MCGSWGGVYSEPGGTASGSECAAAMMGEGSSRSIESALAHMNDGALAEEGSCGSGCKTTGGGVNGASMVHVTAGTGTSPSRRNGIASLLSSSGRLSDMGGGMARVAGDGVGGAFRALATTGVTAGPPCVQQMTLSSAVDGGSSGAGGGRSSGAWAGGDKCDMLALAGGAKEQSDTGGASSDMGCGLSDIARTGGSKGGTVSKHAAMRFMLDPPRGRQGSLLFWSAAVGGRVAEQRV